MNKSVRSIHCQAEDIRNLDYVKKLISEYCPLGTSMNGPFGWTISLPTRQKMKACLVRKNKPIKIAWENCTPRQQMEYFSLYLERVVKPLVGNAIAIPELTKAGNIHIHLLCWNDGGVNEYDMACIRKTAFQLCYKIHKGKTKHGMHLNYIHNLDDPATWLIYISKELFKHTNPIFIVS